jgi:hypothetical protein
MSFGRARQPQLPEGRSEYLVGAVDSRSIPVFGDSATGPWMPGPTLGDASGIEHAGPPSTRHVLRAVDDRAAPEPTGTPPLGGCRKSVVDESPRSTGSISWNWLLRSAPDRDPARRTGGRRAARRRARCASNGADRASGRRHRGGAGSEAGRERRGDTGQPEPQQAVSAGFDRARRDDHCCDLGARGRSAAPVALAA